MNGVYPDWGFFTGPSGLKHLLSKPLFAGLSQMAKKEYILTVNNFGGYK
jgi:hypothetical protein